VCIYSLGSSGIVGNVVGASGRNLLNSAFLVGLHCYHAVQARMEDNYLLVLSKVVESVSFWYDLGTSDGTWGKVEWIGVESWDDEKLVL